ncbi:MAG TPA: hypothetical protein VG757_04285 [Devosia sp.]|nr:hypothetical protein [Devosia sp.]
MRGRMVLALTVALVEQARRPWIVDGQIVGMIGPRLRLLAPEGAVADTEARIEGELVHAISVPEVVIPPEDRKHPTE